ncbi:MAG: histidinol dehydrogenase [Eubacteriales bacterium]|nr:histidinol dehydrogenase [Eubacteriales bacterium]
MQILKESKTRTPEETLAVQESVSSIIRDVRTRGDAAVREYSEKFDQNTRSSYRVSDQEIQNAMNRISEEQKADLHTAIGNIRAFAEAQRNTLTEVHDFQPMPGIYLSDRVIPVNSCLCYVPGGRFPLFSSAMMLIVPAKTAGVPRVVTCSPIQKETGTIDDMTLAAMHMAGADEIYALGGVQAVSAFAYGTETIRPVDLIVGPGNQYVAEAKRQCYGQVGIDFVAGPSEVLAICDRNADPSVVASDLLAQSEHDPNAKGILVTTDREFGKAVIACVEKELSVLPSPDVARQSWNTYGEVILADSLDEAAAIANDIAPEHLEINVKNPDAILDQFMNYGSLFLGGNTAEVFGDYASGTNHTLPTVRAARYTGGVWVGTFLKVCTHQRMTKEASKNIAPLVERLAKAEGLMAHAYAAAKRK